MTQNPLRDRDRFVVADSKVVFKRSPRCEKRLETTVLGFLSLLDPERSPPPTSPTCCGARPPR